MPYRRGSKDTASVWKEYERLRDLVCELGFINQFSAPEILFSLSVSLFTRGFCPRPADVEEKFNKRLDVGHSLELMMQARRLSRRRKSKVKVFPVAMAEGSHLFPSRTQKLSLPAPMVLPWRRGGRVGHCRVLFRRPVSNNWPSFFCA